MKINGVIGSIMDIETPPPPMQISNTLSSAETQQALQNPRFTRRGDGTYSVNAPDLSCGKMLSQINVQTGFVPQHMPGRVPDPRMASGAVTLRPMASGMRTRNTSRPARAGGFTLVEVMVT